ncbi:MAG TPA: hypothetical protein VIU41_14055 [Geobacteraceae bacterium]
MTVPLLCLALCLAGGCANREMTSVITSWQNQPATDVIAAWGPPSEELKTEEKLLLIWTTYDGILAPPEAKRSPSPAGVGYCVRLLEVGGNGRIIHGAWEGDDCPGLFSGWGR